MKNKMKLGWLAAALLALAGLSGRAGAANTSSYLDIDVTFSASKSVAVDSVNSSSYTAPWNGTANAALLSPSSATVTNDSGFVTESWKLFTNPNSLPVSGSSWTATASSSSVGADQFSVQAVFGSSHTVDCTALTNGGTWNVGANAPVLPTSYAAGLQYTSAGQLASTELNNNGTQLPDSNAVGNGAAGVMYGGSKRALCWRVIAPTTTAATATQNIQVIVAAF